MGAVTEYLDSAVYPQYTSNWDDEMLREAILEVIEPDSRCLDYGAGRGHLEHLDFRGRASDIAGIDPDSCVLENPFLNEARVLDLTTNRIEYPDSSFDLIYSDNVLEHLENPDETFAEMFRVLKPGGRFLAKTPNACHYMPLIARFAPQWFHGFYNRLRGRDEIDTFPTRYRANSRKRIEQLARTNGLEVVSIRLIEGRPEYLRGFFLTYLAGIAYEKVVNSSKTLAFARCVLQIDLIKPAEQATASSSHRTAA
jgi:SAM-dependent methyltransferase